MFCRNPRLHRGWRQNIRDPTRRRVIVEALAECVAERRTESRLTQDGAGRRRQRRRQFFAPEGDWDVPSGFAKNGDAPAIPGIDDMAAAMILIEIGDDLSRFGSADRLASWAALCPGNNESAGKRKSGKTRKGNTIVRYLLCEAANAARRTKSVFASKYNGLVIRRGHKKAIVALAHKLIRTIFFVLNRRLPYRDSGFDYEAASVAKNAPRWIKALKKFGLWHHNAPAAA
ncbi:transposase [Methylococcus geothermalis]|uniref:Transposase n=1 Tax=Methylococcus geothermalis TaxID=2681310 RepID=A0A858Q6X7_9GAMM|nr:transposase [Methylococcus geothermalis]